MRKALPLIVAALAAFGLSLIAWLPPSLLAGWLPPEVSATGLSGSLWRGRADSLTLNRQFSLGAFEWQLRPAQLLRGKLALDGHLIRPDGDARARVAFGLGGNVDFAGLEGHWPLTALPKGIAPAAWQGELSFQLPQFSIGKEGISQVQGRVEVRNLRAPPPNGASIGGYELIFDAASRQAQQLIGRIRDLEGPMEVSGTVALGPGPNYVVDGMVTPRANAPQAVTDTLRFLGSPDAQGRRPFSIGGSY